MFDWLGLMPSIEASGRDAAGISIHSADPAMNLGLKDLIVTMGAGNVCEISKMLVERTNH